MSHEVAKLFDSAGTVPPLAMRPKACAKALDISPRLLWTLTDRWEIPHVRLGKRVIVYPVAEIQKWLAEKAAKQVNP